MVAISNSVVIKSFYFICSEITEALAHPIWIQSSGSQLRFWCPGLVSLKLLANVTVAKWHTPSGKCTSEVIHLKRTKLDGLAIAFSSGTKLLAKVITTILIKKVCELNNRTKEARPEDFILDETRFYMKRANSRGTHFSPRLFSFSNATTQQFWRLQLGFQFMSFMVFYPIVVWVYVTNFADTNKKDNK